MRCGVRESGGVLMSAVPSRLRQLDLFLEEPPSPGELGAEEAALQARYDSLAEQWKLPRARVVLSTRRATGGVIPYGSPPDAPARDGARHLLRTLGRRGRPLAALLVGCAKAGRRAEGRSGDRAPAPCARGERALRLSLPGVHGRVDAAHSLRARAPLRLL